MATFELGPLQRKWIEALRSGKYSQARGYLCTGDAYCCLGVACEVAGLMPKRSGNFYLFGADESFKAMPGEVKDYFQFHSRGGHFALSSPNEPTPQGRPSLALANDNGATFAEIADFIEAHPEAVFTGPA